MPSLESYIARVFDEQYARPSLLATKRPRFTPVESSPQLRKDRVNRILAYPGSFHPPHRGHLAVLSHGFLHGGRGLDLIAAVILPRDDDKVARKCERHNEPLMYTRKDRALLWKEDTKFPPWAWVYDGSDRSFGTFRRELKALTRADGYRVEFVALGGPDTVSPHAKPEKSFSTNTVIISDIAREADFDGCQGLPRLDHFGTWTALPLDEKENCSDASGTTGPASAAPQNSLTCPNPGYYKICDDVGHDYKRVKTSSKEFIENPTHIEFCRHKWKVKVTFRYVRSTLEQNKLVRGISSTKVREATRTLQGDELKEVLDEMALSPDLLKQLSSCKVELDETLEL
ncbi:MAG: hypothetical protein Q9217_004398 [Psora testacea]